MLQELIENYVNASNRLILLDYDGTLVNYKPLPDQAKPSAELLLLLKRLSRKPKTSLYIISGRGHYDIEKILDNPTFNMIAEHGAMIKEHGEWKKETPGNGSWKHTLLPIFNRITLTCPKSFVEEKHFSLTWHYRNAEPKAGYDHSRELIRAINDTVRSYKLKVIDGNKIVEVINSVTGKGIAVNNLLAKSNYDYILAIGDDTTDEDMFGVLQASTCAYTVKVGKGDSLAKYRLNNPEEVTRFLKLLTNEKCEINY